MDTEPESQAPLKPSNSVDQSVLDARDLAALGHDQALSRKFDIWSMLALAFCVLGTWSTFAQDLASGLTNGGPVSILWGLCLVTFCNLCVAVSLGELCSSMPTALGQAYWVHRLWEGKRLGRFASYMCAWINMFGWWTLTASQIGFMTNFMLGMKVMFDNNWPGASEGWVQFLDKFLPYFNDFVGIWFCGLFVVFSLALLISVGTKPDLSFQPASFVFGTWINQTGWSDGVTWFIGLVQAAYGLTAFDSVIHLVEEIPAPRRNAPRAIYLAVACGALSGFIFMLVCLFCIQDVDAIINSATGLPFMDLVQNAIGTKGGVALIALFEFNGLGQGVSIATTASRLTWGFARDSGLPFSSYFAHIDPTWKVPARALWLQGILIGLVGILYLFANTVLNAILSVSTIALTISYGIPIFALLIVGRDKLPSGGTFRLGRRLGPVVNWISVIYCCITTVFFFFPGSPNPAASDMNYAIAVFGVMLVIAVGFWFIRGHKDYLLTESSAERLMEAQRLENEEITVGVPPTSVGDNVDRKNGAVAK
ncbi:amino acid permease family protein, putative [Talaromyces stipitatus ATCC 10500]|uniref:Amino acid permease family protein, putative n=1 Tax=Talaromyces stipitatus (strain ATCC 10500 / CBS 375.48 / QM 6759 / NRRL 1006) TaxID=441959 RepID=B8MTG2_TALSN|nr:amino acid permease family protein, putative [Talaromyces stipitatus ATCC 10500]EED12294.1 amino acid permease family protein, putative [Talaromyces stipitatus ATCC 10500]